DPVFDPRYVIKSDHADFVREFLEPRVQKAIEDLRALRGNDKILISINSARLMVRKEGIVGSLPDLTVLADLAFVVYDRLYVTWQRESGIEILDEGPPDPTATPICQVCGSPIPADYRVYCRRCRTPHHRDCWEFNGQCSTYACGEKRTTLKY
ncbi:MAG TPA: RING finger protein, partial [Planctomycetota bacterium]|nr:RING finger protein [Planctomycetota bacterium]